MNDSNNDLGDDDLGWDYDDGYYDDSDNDLGDHLGGDRGLGQGSRPP